MGGLFLSLKPLGFPCRGDHGPVGLLADLRTNPVDMAQPSLHATPTLFPAASFRIGRNPRLKKLIGRQPEEIRDAIEVAERDAPVWIAEGFGDPALCSTAPH